MFYRSSSFEEASLVPLASNAKDVSRLREGGAPRVEVERGAGEQVAEMERVEHCSEERAARSHM